MYDFQPDFMGEIISKYGNSAPTGTDIIAISIYVSIFFMKLPN